MPLRMILLFIAIGLMLLGAIAPAAAQNREMMVNGLVADSRDTIMQSIEALPALGNKTALAALVALQDKRSQTDKGVHARR